MKTIKELGAQGDVLFRRVSRVPSGFEVVTQEGPIVVAHSETGHHHTVPGLHAMLYAHRSDTLVSYLVMGDVQALEVTHHRPHDTHETIALLGKAGTVWEVRRQREHTPEGWRRVED